MKKPIADGIRVYCSHDKIVKIDELKPNPKNPNQHPDEQIELLAKIIQSNGWRARIVVSNLSGMIVKGHGRYQAAVLAGLGEVPVEYQDYASRDDEIKDLIADNKISEFSKLSYGLVREIIESLPDINLDETLDLSMFGFDEIELAKLLDDDTTILGIDSIDKDLFPIKSMVPHPRNYRKHPDNQLEHIIKSIQVNGLYQEVILSSDNVILRGHSIYEAAKKMGIKQVPVTKVNIKSDSVEALKILINDNDFVHLSVIDDRAMVKLLAEIKERDELLGTGYDSKMVSALNFVTRPPDTIRSVNYKEHWQGMPEYENGERVFQVSISFEDENDRLNFLKFINATVINHRRKRVWSIWWPERKIADVNTIEFQD